MRTWVARLCGCLLLLPLAGCGENGDNIKIEQIKVMNDTADALENNAPQATMDELEKRRAAASLKLSRLSADEQKKLVEKYKDQYDKAAERIAAAQTKKMVKEMQNVQKK